MIKVNCYLHKSLERYSEVSRKGRRKSVHHDIKLKIRFKSIREKNFKQVSHTVKFSRYFLIETQFIYIKSFCYGK